MGYHWTCDAKDDVMHWTVSQKNTKWMLFRLRRTTENGRRHIKFLEHRKLCFQNQRRQSLKEGTGTAGKKVARVQDKTYSPVVRSGNTVEWTRAKFTKQLQLSAIFTLYNYKQAKLVVIVGEKVTRTRRIS